MKLYIQYLKQYMDWFQFIQANPDTIKVDKLNYSGLSFNPNITWDVVQANPDKPWNYLYLSCNPNITWEIVRDNPDKPWDYEMLSLNKMSKHSHFKQQFILW